MDYELRIIISYSLIVKINNTWNNNPNLKVPPTSWRIFYEMLKSWETFLVKGDKRRSQKLRDAHDDLIFVGTSLGGLPDAFPELFAGGPGGPGLQESDQQGMNWDLLQTILLTYVAKQTILLTYLLTYLGFFRETGYHLLSF
jgi:hypothetical protein